MYSVLNKKKNPEEKKIKIESVSKKVNKMSETSNNNQDKDIIEANEITLTNLLVLLKKYANYFLKEIKNPKEAYFNYKKLSQHPDINNEFSKFLVQNNFICELGLKLFFKIKFQSN